MEHAALDGVTIEPLHNAINDAIAKQHESGVTEVNKSESRGKLARLGSTSIEKCSSLPLPMTAHSDMYSVMRTISNERLGDSESFSFATMTSHQITQSFCLEHKTPLQGSLQLALQLAARRLFGHILPATETVSLAHFRHGRVDVNAIVTTPMMAFLDEATVDSHPRRVLRDLADNATREYVSNLRRVSRGQGYGRHLLALEWMIADTEERPSFFDDPSYLKSKPGRILTSCFNTGWQEGGFVYPPANSILIYFEISEER
ncbi:uncharacterized protein N7483_000823 [Penicillium malachiteum]|uniref:uncharacterized protein n=1 Tax=Penicillium malachiteum TaxID=1324776 RepID=UPI00254778FB|nr:uncharacterized protein N7483_000823 [Penicillium malachiteum]KAJ5735698.1 hypothetical protein N7483_000823 [Penicillium malachiteum]